VRLRMCSTLEHFHSYFPRVSADQTSCGRHDDDDGVLVIHYCYIRSSYAWLTEYWAWVSWIHLENGQNY
jgi:hypothetical protein